MLSALLTPERTEQLRIQLDTARRRLDTARDRTGRAATVAGAAAATAGLFGHGTVIDALAGTVAATGVGLVLLPTRRANGRHLKHTAVVLYLLPGTTLTALLVTERILTAPNWWEALALAAWSAGVWLLRPALSARRMLVPPLPPLAVPTTEVAASNPDEHPAARWWSEQVAIEDGAAPATVLEDVERTGNRSMRAVIRSTIPGRPVPDISVRHLSALMDVEEDLISVGPVAGRGASVRLLTVGQAQELDPYALWTQRIAPVAMPGAVLTEINFGRMRPPVDTTKN